MTAISTIRSGTLLTHEIEIKRSRFVATIARTDSPQEAQAVIDAVKNDHPQARHNCSAYLIQVDGRNPHQHSSDDGEPAGTAGTPMLEALRGAGVWNVTAVVTRYFGGVLLGAGGLVRAYSTAVSEALALAPRAELRTLEVLEAHLSPTDAGRIEADLRHCGAHILDARWGGDVLVRVGTERSEVPFLQERLAQLTGGAAAFEMAGATIIEVDIDSSAA